MRPDTVRNKNKFCLFHRDHGHDTDECYQHKREIENLIQCGYLGKFVRKPKTSAKGEEPMETLVDNQPTEHQVNFLDRLSFG